MKITIYGKQMSVRESLKEAVEKKLSKFDKFFGENTEAFVTCKVRKGVKIIEITVNYGGTTFRSEEENETFITALDRAAEGLERQIRKNKTRVEKMVKKGSFVTPFQEVLEMKLTLSIYLKIHKLLSLYMQVIHLQKIGYKLVQFT